MKDVKITVKKIINHDDLIKEFENPIEHTCSMAIGQSFLSVRGKKPEGFCDSAWDSVKPFVKALAKGKGNFFDGWMKDEFSAMISCNDGFRPVSFYIELADKNIK